MSVFVYRYTTAGGGVRDLFVRVVFLFSLYSMFSVGLYEDCRPFDDNYSLQVGCDSQLVSEPFILF